MRCAAVALVAAGFALAQQTQPAPPPEAAPTPAPPAATGQALRLSIALDLSAEQTTEVQTIVDNETSQLQPLLPQLGENREAIHKLALGGATGEAFDTQIQSLATAQGSLVSQVAAIRAKSLSRIWALLTPPQRERAMQMPRLLDPENPGIQARPRNPRGRPMRPLRPPM
jgi:Spy/CpxP family protein refolding chaperone